MAATNAVACANMALSNQGRCLCQNREGAGELAATPDRVELSALYFSNLPEDSELLDLVKLDVTETVRRRDRPRWQPRWLTEDCSAFFQILKAAFLRIAYRKYSGFGIR